MDTHTHTALDAHRRAARTVWHTHYFPPTFLSDEDHPWLCRCQGIACKRCVEQWAAEKDEDGFPKSVVICPVCNCGPFPGEPKKDDPAPVHAEAASPAVPVMTLGERLEELRRPHWLSDSEITFIQKVITLYANDIRRPAGLLHTANGRTTRVIEPANAVYNVDAMGPGQRGVPCGCETSVFKTGDWFEPTFRATYMRYNIQNVGGSHWVGAWYQFQEGAATDSATTVCAIDTIRGRRGGRDVRKAHAKMIKRGAMFSATASEPPPGVNKMVGVPLVTEQGDGTSCGAMQLAYYYLVATDNCHPNLRDFEEGSISRIDLAWGEAIYEWLVKVVRSLGMVE